MIPAEQQNSEAHRFYREALLLLHESSAKFMLGGAFALFLVWCKIYVQNRERFDGADVNHIILRHRQQFDWK